MWSPTRPAVIILADATGHFQVWDFTDSSNKPSVVLKATHEKIVSMEFMPSTNTRQQLVAIGDEVGTLHIYEMPRSLIRPVPREEEIMTHFLSREWERIEYLEAIPNIDGFGTVDHLLSQVERAGTAETEMPGLDDAAAAGLEEVTPEGGEDEEEEDFAMTATGEGLGGGAQGGAVLDKKALREQFKKEEEDYLKMEAAFLEELGIDVETLPDAIRATMLSSPEKK
jgi:dynein intermediate chain 3, axonemal